MLTKLYILIGLPASGKSTWAQEQSNILEAGIFSSDEYRERMLGDVNDQSHNSDIFAQLHRDIKTELLSGKNCIYDATNMNRKDRRTILELSSGVPNLEKIAILFATPVEICKERNAHRNRVVPEHVYDRMLGKFEMPVKGEGFDKIEIIPCLSASKLNQWQLTDRMQGFDQKNPHHQHTLFEHSIMTQQWCIDHAHEHIPECVVANNKVKTWISKNCVILMDAAILHDYGKLFTQTIDKEGVAHYHNHENVGAYRILTEFSKPFAPEVATIINYHMVPYGFNQMNNKKQKQIVKELAEIWDLVQILHLADASAH